MHKGDFIPVFGGVFLLGVFIASLGLMWLLILAGVTTTFFVYRKFGEFSVISLVVVSLLAGFFYFHIHDNWRRGDILAFTSEKRFVEVESEPVIYERHQRFQVESRGLEFTLITSPEEFYKKGDVLEVIGGKIEIEKGENFLVFPRVKINKQSDKEPNIFEGSYGYISRSFAEHFKTDEAALLSGLTIGDQRGFTSSFKKDLRTSGTSHIVALSGYNIAILVAFLYFSLSFFMRRSLVFYVATAIIVGFILFVGAQASIVRAGVMGFLILLASEKGRVYSIKNSIIFAALVMVLIDPHILKYGVGFQLSFLSLLGMIYISPGIKKLWEKATTFDLAGLRENFSNTLSAQIAVLPVVLNTFGAISFMGVVSNILILSLVPLIMFLGFIFLIINALSSQLASLLALFMEFPLSYILKVIQATPDVGISLQAGWAIFAGYYALLVWVIYRIKQNEAS